MLELAWTTFSKKYVMLHFLYTLSLIDMSLAYKSSSEPTGLRKQCNG